MAKLASQVIAFQLSKAVKDSADDDLSALTEEMIEQLTEILSEIVDDSSVIVELVTYQ